MIGARILVADDSMVVRAVIRKQLATSGFDIEDVDCGEAALEVCRANPPDVLLLDVEMPGISGYEVLAELQADDKLCGIPVIFLSGRVSVDDVSTGLRLGAHDYLRKPVETGELIARVAAAVRTKALQDELRRDDDNLRQLAPVDRVTGALEATGTRERLTRLAHVARVDGRPLGAVAVEVAGLEQFDRRYGDGASDEVMARVADIVRGQLRAGDVLGRTAVNQLLVLLPDTWLDAASALAKQLAAWATTPINVGDDFVSLPVTTAGGMTVTGSVEQLLADLHDGLSTARVQPVIPAAVVTPNEMWSAEPTRRATNPFADWPT